MPYKIQITKINQHPDGVTPAAETQVFTQSFDEIDLPTLVLALNKRPRVRKSRAAAAKQEKA